MKPATILTIATLLAACSSNSDRPGSIEERRERIANDRAERVPGDPALDLGEAEADMEPAREPVARDFDRDGDGLIDADQLESQEGETAGQGSAQPDNTARNERDREDPEALTPVDQSNSSTDLEITQAIRKKVVGADDLSFNAKNVKIITVAGKVTLRGPVESSEESKTIERSARDVPGVKTVVNQLEVK